MYQESVTRQLADTLTESKEEKADHEKETIRRTFETNPTWNKTFGPIQKKQSTILKAKIIGILLISLGNARQHIRFGGRR